jgi:hypothetical protein
MGRSHRFAERRGAADDPRNDILRRCAPKAGQYINAPSSFWEIARFILWHGLAAVAAFTRTHLMPRYYSIRQRPFRTVPLRCLFAMTLAFVPEMVRADDAPGQEPRAFDLPSGEAAATLRLFSTQAGVQLLVSSDDIRGIKTKEVHGELRPLAAIQKMLENTQLVAREDRATGTIAVVAAASAPDAGSVPPKPNKPKKTSEM